VKELGDGDQAEHKTGAAVFVGQRDSLADDVRKDVSGEAILRLGGTF